MRTALKIVISIATAGRRAILNDAVMTISDQTRPPDRLIICPASDEDIDFDLLATCRIPAEIVRGGKGLTVQRNVTLDYIGRDADVIVFFDDDFIPAPNYLERLEQIFVDHDDIVMVTGHVLADGKKGPGIEASEGLHIARNARPASKVEMTDVFNGYGCNMAFRWSKIRDAKPRFDENLPLYSWLEDVDFSRQVAGFGRLVQSNQLLGVHLGTKIGRTPGVRFGYSQIVNQIYLVRKGSVRVRDALLKVVQNVGANTIGSIRPEPFIDRRGRLRGNVRAVFDLVIGRASPLRVLEL